MRPSPKSRNAVSTAPMQSSIVSSAATSAAVRMRVIGSPPITLSLAAPDRTPKHLMQIIENLDAALDSLRVIANAADQSGDHHRHPRALRAIEFRLLQVDVVHDLGDRAHAFVRDAGAPHQRLQRAAVAFVREIAAGHIEADLPIARLRLRVEAEARFRIEEAADEPGGGEAIDANVRPRHPDFSAQREFLFRHALLLLL